MQVRLPPHGAHSVAGRPRADDLQDDRAGSAAAQERHLDPGRLQELGIGWDAAHRLDREQLELLFGEVIPRRMTRMVIDEIAVYKSISEGPPFGYPSQTLVSGISPRKSSSPCW